MNFKLLIVIPFYNKRNNLSVLVEHWRKWLHAFSDIPPVELLIVDNSISSETLSLPDVFIVKNHNRFGCSGGFTRGILYAVDSGIYTHCLFADDDSMFDIYIIDKVIPLISQGDDDRVAISATFFYDHDVTMIHEKGGVYGTPWRSLKKGLDISTEEGRAAAEAPGEAATYGAFWFFAFPLKHVKHFLFPFFLRGEDVMFGTMNGFNIYTRHDIACYGPDFAPKDTALTRYLDMRAQIVIGLCEVLPVPTKNIYYRMRSEFFRYLYSANYASARAIRLALRDVMKGREFWESQSTILPILQEIEAISCDEKKQAVNVDAYGRCSALEDFHEGALRKWIRRMSFHGLFLPPFLRISKRVITDSNRYHQRKSFWHSRFLHTYVDRSLGYEADFSWWLCARELLLYFFTLGIFRLQLKQLKCVYREMLPYLTSEAFWRKALKLDVKKAGP
jgi:glycosyltransferase involved in cell wall biosynthesis